MAVQGATCNVENVHEILSCVWCKGSFKTPLIHFECFHHSCKECLDENIGKLQPKNIFECPACETSFDISNNRWFRSEPLQRLVSDNGEHLCGICRKKTLENGKSCITCNMQLCYEDASSHQMNMPDHHIFSYAELKKQPKLYQICTQRSNVSAKVMCHEHSLEMDRYCKQCDIFVCTACPTHFGHLKVSIKDMAVEYREKIELQITLIRRTKASFQEHIEKLKTKKKEVGDNCKGFLRELNMKKRNVLPELEGSVTKMTKHAQTLKDEIETRLRQQKSKIKRCDSSRAYLQYFIMEATDLEVVQNRTSVLNFSKNCIENEGNVDFAIPKYNFQFFEEKALTLQSCDLKTKWDSEWWTGVKVSRDEVILVKGKRIVVVTLNGEVKGDIECEDLVDAWDVDIHEDRLYVSDTYPKKREVLIIGWNGAVTRKICLPDEESSSDAPLGVSVDKQNGAIFVASAASNTIYKYTEKEGSAKQFITKDLNYPWYLCVTQHHEIAVSNVGSHTVCLYGNSGNLLWKYGGKGSDRGQLEWPLGVCSDQWRHIYVADLDNNRIHHISAQTGKFLRYIDINEKVLRPWAVTMFNRQLIVTTHSVHTTQPLFVINCNYK